VHLIGDIVDDAARPDGNGVVLIELRPRADQEGSGQDRDESLIRMRVRLAPIVGAPFGSMRGNVKRNHMTGAPATPADEK
jgi:hypothetical protein